MSCSTFFPPPSVENSIWPVCGKPSETEKASLHFYKVLSPRGTRQFQFSPPSVDGQWDNYFQCSIILTVFALCLTILSLSGQILWKFLFELEFEEKRGFFFAPFISLNSQTSFTENMPSEYQFFDFWLKWHTLSS